MSPQYTNVQDFSPARLRILSRTAVEQHRHRQALAAARVLATSNAAQLGHQVGAFQVLPVGYEIAGCGRCYAAVAIITETAWISTSERLNRPCEGHL